MTRYVQSAIFQFFCKEIEKNISLGGTKVINLKIHEDRISSIHSSRYDSWFYADSYLACQIRIFPGNTPIRFLYICCLQSFPDCCSWAWCRCRLYRHFRKSHLLALFVTTGRRRPHFHIIVLAASQWLS